MAKYRREFLGVTAAVGMSAIAGCGIFPSGGSKVTPPELVGFTQEDAECSQQQNGTAEVSQSEGEEVDKTYVEIEGVIVASSTCRKAVYRGFTYNEKENTGTITVSTVEQDGAQCEDCYASIPYRFRVHFKEGMPGRLKIVHDGANKEEVSLTKLS